MAELMAQLKSQAVGEWEPVGESYFARESLYDMAWGDFEVEDKRLACAPYGGPIAAIRDERRIVVLLPGGPGGAGGGDGGAGGGGGLRPVLRTFTASGVGLGAVEWSGGRLVDWGWTDEQQLATVEANGKVTLFSARAEVVGEFTFGAAVERDGVAAARVYGSGVVVVTEPRLGGPGGAAAAASLTPGSIWVVSDLRNPRPVRMASPPQGAYDDAATTTGAGAGASAATAGASGGLLGLSGGILGLSGLGRRGLPQCLAVLEPRTTLSSGVEVLVAVGGSLWQLDDTAAAEYHPAALRAAGAATHLAVSPDGAFVALYTRDDRLLVMSADLTQQLTEFETRGAGCAPSGLHWVGADAVLLTWHDTAVLVGPYADHLQLDCDEGITSVIPEVDGCRLLLGRSTQQLLRKVPDSLAQVFGLGAMGPSARLWESRALYDDQNPRCDRILRDIQDIGPSALSAAVASCVQAAGHDLSPERQRALMRAAAYGRPFCPPDFPRQLMYGVACRLRVLAAVRDPRVGIPLTMAQLEVLTLPVLVARLIAYRQWLLAYRIAGGLRTIPGALPPPQSSAAASTGKGAAAAAAAAAGPAGPAASGPGGRPAGRGSGLMAQEQVLVQWACARITAASTSGAAVDDGQLKDVIVAKLKGCPHVRYAPLAAHALSMGRRRLALRLLEEERSAAQQVPLLLSLAVGAAGRAAHGQGRPAAGGGGGGEEEGDSADEVLQRALRKAIESGDTDLVYLVLFGSYRSRPLSEFWSLAAPRAPARNLFVKYCRAKEPELLETILTAASAPGGITAAATTTGGTGPGSAAAAAVAAATAAFPPSAAAAELAGLQFRAALEAQRRAVRAAGGGAGGGGGGGGAGAGGGVEAAASKLAAALSDVSQKYAQSRECAFQSRAAAEMSSLLREQSKMERETGQRLFVGLSLVDTVRTAIRLGHHRAAAGLKKQFAITDRRFAWIKVRTLAEARDWEALEGYAAELRRSPIGWEPFVEAAKKWNAPLDYRARLVTRLPDSPAKAEEFSALGLAKDAAEVAARIKDSDLFARIQAAVAAGSPAALAIAQIKERFQSTFR